ncbi:hypothetical protein U2181_15575, partial [Listeria monocytogenes]|uniref:hypothetical protein n=1 Tax=Listeria monocytogenes TaxID=1639 RepID=UPI002FDBB1CF
WLVRTRKLIDIRGLCSTAEIKPSRIVSTPDSDYIYRIEVSSREKKKIFKVLSESIDYPNFKSQVQTQQLQRHKLNAYT